MVELQPSKLAMRVRFPSPAPEFEPAEWRARQEREHGLAGDPRGVPARSRIEKEATDLVTGLKKNGEGKV
jgi:hypothetical protein